MLSKTLAQVKAVAEAARSRRALRHEIMQSNGWSLRDLYRTLETPGANRHRPHRLSYTPSTIGRLGLHGPLAA